MEEPKENLKDILKEWGNFKFKENCVYLYDNAYLQDKKFIDIVKAHGIKIQLDLFT